MKTRIFTLLALVSAFLFAQTPAAHAQRYGVDGGVFIPSSSRTREAFGSTFYSFGPGFGTKKVGERRISPDLDIMRQDRRGNEATVIMVGAKVLTPLTKNPAARLTGFLPYGGFGLNATYADIDAPAFNVNDSGFGLGASAILGARLGTHFYVEGRYRLSTRVADFSFSGAQLGLGVRF